MIYKLAAVLFRRDLRVNDNTALLQAAEQSAEILAVFCLNPEQLENNKYRGDNSVQFMQDSLQDLDSQLHKHSGKLNLFAGTPELLVEELKKLGVEAVFANKDYTPYALKRDSRIGEACKKSAIEFKLYDDYLLHAPEVVTKADGKPYTIYTPFYKRATQIEVPVPSSLKNVNFTKINLNNFIDVSALKLINDYSDKILKGGRNEALKVLRDIANYKDYKEQRDFPALDSTTKLSAHLKFGTISARELYHLVKKYHASDHSIIKELYWRDFFTQVAFHFPYVFEGSFNPKYKKLLWDQDLDKFDRWCKGITGFPIIDAGMRELNETGYMHNRVRMIVASFLIKDLHISWQWGEIYFAQRLCDYDPAVNNGNWQWAASTGCDAAPYFRIFNPWLQQKKFDPDAIYIKRWIPELKDLNTKAIHNWENEQLINNYPAPIVRHDLEKIETLQRYASAD